MSQPVQLHPALRRRLRGLGLRLRLAVAALGLAWVVVALVAAAMLTLVVDYGIYLLARQHLSVAQRLLVIALGVCGVAVVAWRHLLSPMGSATGEDDLALVVERRHPELGDRLISALQFGRMGDGEARGQSQALIDLVVQQANRMALPLRFADALRLRPLRRAAAVAMLVVLLVAALATWRSDLAACWFGRTILLNETLWPRDTYLAVDTANLRVARGSPLTLKVTADPKHHVPAEVTFHMDFPGVGSVQETVQAARPGEHVFLKTVPSVGDAFTFHVTGHDDRTAEHRVEVVEPPYLQDVSWRVQRPAYMRLEELTLSAAQGTLNLPAQSVVTVSALATKDLNGAAILLDGQPVADCPIRPEHRRLVAGRFTVPVPQPYKPTLQLRFSLTDAEGFTSTQTAQYTIVLVPDRAPVVQLAARGIGGQISTRAVIPLEIASRDDYGVRELEVEWSLLSAGERRQRQAVVLFEPDQKEPAPVTWRLDLAAVGSAPPRVPATAPTTAEPAAVQVGESIRIVAIAKDTTPSPEGPQAAISNAITLRVVSDEELLASLVDAQRQMREQFRQAITMQSEARTRTAQASDKAGASATLAEAAQLGGEANDLQQQITDRVAAVASRFAEILDQLINNRIGAEPDQRRMKEKIIDPLAQLGSQVLPRLNQELSAARAACVGPEARAGIGLQDELARLAGVQGEVLARLEAVLAEMVKVESAQQVERAWKQLLEQSTKVRQITRSAGGPASKPKDTAP